MYAGEAASNRMTVLVVDDDPKAVEAGKLYAFARAARCGVMAIPERISLEALEGHRFPRELRRVAVVRQLRHLVREVDAFDGIIARAADAAPTQNDTDAQAGSLVLNTCSKPAA